MNQPVKRAQWKSHYGFLMATLGSAVGLGNIWRFSYKAYENGGGAFLIPYVIAVITAGIPLLILEFGIGHERIGSAPLAFAKYRKKWEWIGWWAIVFIMFGIELYYSVIISWCVNYFKLAFNFSGGVFKEGFGWGNDPSGFFDREFLNVSTGPWDFGGIQPEILIGLAIVWASSWFIIYRGVTKGLELANKIFIPLLFVLISILVVYSLTLEGAMIGLKAYLVPDFEVLMKPKTWLDAYSQVFFSLGLGFGIMITYASYLPKKSNLTRAAITTGILDSAFAIFAGVAVFAVLGFMAHSSGKDISNVVKSGPGLAFIAYPEALNEMTHKFSATLGVIPIGKVIGILFFLSLIVAGFSSSISIFEAFTSAIVDKFQWNRKIVVSVIAVTGFTGGIIFTTGAGIHWLDIVDHFLNQYGLVAVGFLECVVVGWFFRITLLRYHINLVSSFQLGSSWNWMIRMFIPLVLMIIIGGGFFQEIAKPYGGYIPDKIGVIDFKQDVLNKITNIENKDFIQSNYSMKQKNIYSLNESLSKATREKLESIFKSIGYSKYGVTALLIIGFGWLLFTVILALFLSSLKWTINIVDHPSRSDDYNIDTMK